MCTKPDDSNIHNPKLHLTITFLQQPGLWEVWISPCDEDHLSWQTWYQQRTCMVQFTCAYVWDRELEMQQETEGWRCIDINSKLLAVFFYHFFWSHLENCHFCLFPFNLICIYTTNQAWSVRMTQPLASSLWDFIMAWKYLNSWLLNQIISPKLPFHK